MEDKIITIKLYRNNQIVKVFDTFDKDNQYIMGILIGLRVAIHQIDVIEENSNIYRMEYSSLLYPNVNTVFNTINTLGKPWISLYNYSNNDDYYPFLSIPINMYSIWITGDQDVQIQSSNYIVFNDNKFINSFKVAAETLNIDPKMLILSNIYDSRGNEYAF